MEQELLNKIEKLEQTIEDMRSGRDQIMMESITNELFLAKPEDASILGTQQHLFNLRWKGKVYQIPGYDL
jgi:hypothetical protein